MEISRLLSLSLGIIAGVMFGIVYSKYESYSTVHDNVPAAAAQRTLHLENARQDGLRDLLQVGVKNTNSSVHAVPKVEKVDSKPLEYAVGGKSFYFKFDMPDSLLQKPEQAEIASWETFDPRYDADKLKSALSVFCIIIIGSGQINRYAKPLFQTWTTHCNDFVMLSEKDDPTYKIKNLKVPDSATKQWERTKAAFTYAVNNHPNHDWYLKAEYDDFVAMENYRYMLLMHQAKIRGFAGHVLAGKVTRGSVMSLSKEAATKAVPSFESCGGLYGGKEDYKELEACLKHAGISSSHTSLDDTGVNRYQAIQAHPNLPLNAHSSVDWAWRTIINPDRMGEEDCCMDLAVTFHQVSPNGQYLMEYMVYHMRPFGIGNYVCHPDEKTGQVV